MPITAIPQGIELRKISSTQKKAIDELLKKQKETSLLNTAIPATVVLVIAGGAAAIFLFRDEVTEWAKKQIEGGAISAGKKVADIITTIVGRENPRTPAEFTDAQGNVMTIPRCTRWETDYVDTQTMAQEGGSVTALALAQLNIIKNMKADKCTRPVIIKQSQWDKV